MKQYEEQITINAPADKVYAYVSDFTRHGEWAGHGLAVTKDGDGPVAVGSTFSTTAKSVRHPEGTQHDHRHDAEHDLRLGFEGIARHRAPLVRARRRRRYDDR